MENNYPTAWIAKAKELYPELKTGQAQAYLRGLSEAKPLLDGLGAITIQYEAACKEACNKAGATYTEDIFPSLKAAKQALQSFPPPTPTPLQIWNKAIMVADNVCHNRVKIFAGETEIVDAIELCRKEIMQYFNDEYHIKKMTEPEEDKGPI